MIYKHLLKNKRTPRTNISNCILSFPVAHIIDQKLLYINVTV